MALKDGQWNKTHKGMVFKYHRDFFENLLRKSKITYDQETGVGELYYNFKTEEPINSESSSRVLGSKLKEIFKTKRYICEVSRGKKTKGASTYTNTVKFYFKTPEFPQGIEDMDGIIYPHIVFQEFMRTDFKTGEVEYLSFKELKEKYSKLDVFHIIQECEEPKISPKGKRITIRRCYWEFAK